VNKLRALTTVIMSAVMLVACVSEAPHEHQEQVGAIVQGEEEIISSPESSHHTGVVLQLDPDYADAYFNCGIACRSMGDLDQAIQLQPDYAMAYGNRGNAYAGQGDLDRAIADFDQAIQLQPDDAITHYNCGLAYAEKGEREKAIAEFKQSLALSSDPYVRSQAGEELKALGEK
jgi:tetratricopeptide (TPR) repeat protein